ncbi:MAG: DivIVA domain-containing protein [Actinomycetota bacterium]|nr:DivIVA domain-containing protein [Actinomycetota bacterium]
MFAVLVFILGLLVISGVLFAIGAFVFGRGEELAPAPRDSTPVVLPADRPPDAGDIEALRLSVVLRGYRMLEVDWVLDRLSEALTEKDRQIAALTNQLTRQPPGQSLVAADAPAPPRPIPVPTPLPAPLPTPVPVADDGRPAGA